MFHPWFAAALALLAVGAASYFGVTERLGAHPSWANIVPVIGGVMGAVFAIVLRFLPKVARIVLFAALLGASFAMAWLGKTRFASSFGEDLFAGQVWYFGWIATGCFTAAVLATILMRRRRPAR